MKLTTHKLAFICLSTSLVCSSCTDTLSIETRLVNPCNQAGLDQVDFLKFEPRGTGVDSQGLSSIQPVTAGASSEVPLPLVEDFSLVVTGHVM